MYMDLICLQRVDGGLRIRVTKRASRIAETEKAAPLRKKSCPGAWPGSSLTININININNININIKRTVQKYFSLYA